MIDFHCGPDDDIIGLTPCDMHVTSAKSRRVTVSVMIRTITPRTPKQVGVVKGEDFKSSDPSSNLGGMVGKIFSFFFLYFIIRFMCTYFPGIANLTIFHAFEIK
jgi:hypothetical protein